MKARRAAVLLGLALLAGGVAAPAQRNTATAPADLLLMNGRVYTLGWGEPDREGRPAADAPHTAGGWHPDAQALAIRGDRIVLVGTNAQAMALRGPRTQTIDVHGATVLPGLVDAHVHIAELGASLERVNLVGVATEAEAVDRVEARARQTSKGQWIVGWGWDEGAWANHYPDMALLSARVPDHPVLLRGLHSFAVWGNRLAFERAGITRDTPSPEGGEIRKDVDGRPTGILLNNAARLLTASIPAATPAELEKRAIAGLAEMARSGYVAVHEAAADRDLLGALRALDARNQLPIRVYAMLAQRDEAEMEEWKDRAPETAPQNGGPQQNGNPKRAGLQIRSVKAFYDGALGSRGAALVDDYTDRPGHRGVGGAEYGFRADLLTAMMGKGYQVAIHSIGDRANRETLDFFERAFAAHPAARTGRHRIEHAQVVSPSDMPRFAQLGVIASMQPGHAVEDMAWAEQRLGAERIKGAYAWRSLRRAGARLVLSSDLPGSDYNIFYELHAATTRRDRNLHPSGGWRPEERLTIEEALRGYTTWAAYAAFAENDSGMLAPGRLADVTVIDIDPFVTASDAPDKLLTGSITKTIVGGVVR
jgi:predicted amidohydrolase YtcJ